MGNWGTSTLPNWYCWGHLNPCEVEDLKSKAKLLRYCYKVILTSNFLETQWWDQAVSENAVRVRMAESSLSMDPSLPLQEDSLMMPPPIPTRSVSSDLLQKIQIWKFRFGSTPRDHKEVPHLLLQTQWLRSQRIFSHHRWGQNLTTFELKCRFVSHTKFFFSRG